MLTPFPHQRVGADFLFTHQTALLADDPRVGKNLATIMAADRLGARDILIVTTVSGRAVSRRAFEQNQQLSRTIQVAEPKHTLTGNVVIVSWSSLVNPIMQLQLLSRRWDLIITDESHFAKNFGAKRTRALYGIPVNDGRGLDQKHALAIRADRFWCLSGTPAAHDLGDLYPMLRTLAPELLLAGRRPPMSPRKPISIAAIRSRS